MKKAMLDRGIDITGRSWHSLVCPILLTNADLYFLNNPTIDNIEQSNKVKDVAKACDTIAFSTPRPPLYVRNYIMEHIAKEIRSRFPPKAISESRLMSYLFNTSNLNPSRYYIN